MTHSRDLVHAREVLTRRCRYVSQSSVFMAATAMAFATRGYVIDGLISVRVPVGVVAAIVALASVALDQSQARSVGALSDSQVALMSRGPRHVKSLQVFLAALGLWALMGVLGSRAWAAAS